MSATVFQRNKRTYLDEEGKLYNNLCDKSFQNVFQGWLDATIAELDRLYETCEQQLGELQQSVVVEEGDYWNSRTLMQHCNLHLGEKRLIRKGMDLHTHPSWPDMVRLIAALNALKSKGFISPQQVKFITHVEKELGNVVFEPRELNYITNALETKLRDDTTTRNVFNELTRYQNSIDELSPDLDNCEQLLESAMVNGEMALAEDIAMRQLDMHEHMLKLITDQYPIIHEYYTETEDRKRNRRWAIFRMANKDIATVIEGKHRQIEACEEDLLKLKEQLENYAGDDAFQRKRYAADCQESDTFLAQNKEKQQGVWNRVYDLFQELQKCQDELSDLANLRSKEIDRRLKLEEREAGRRSGHEAFIRVAAEHAQLLQDTIDNAVTAKDIGSALNEFVLDGCDNVTAKFDRQQSALGEMLRLVQNHHFKRFTDFYLSAGRMLYRKEQRMKQLNDALVTANVNLKVASESLDPLSKKHADEVRDFERRKSDVAAEIIKLRRRIADANAAIAPTLRSFDYHGVKYVHPEQILTKVVIDRKERILDYRELVDPDIPQNDTILKEELSALNSRTEEVKAIKAARQSVKASHGAITNYPRPPPTAADSTTRSQYQRFQQLLERKLEVPAPLTSSTSNNNNATTGGAASLIPTLPPIAASLKSGSMTSSTGGGGGAGSGTTAATTSPAVASGPASTALEGASLRALYRYAARAADELSFEKGDIIICVGSAMEAGWYKGMCNQRAGLFPINYVTRAE